VPDVDGDHPRAPCWSRQSVKPPVDAPTSRQLRPAGRCPGPRGRRRASRRPATRSAPRLAQPHLGVGRTRVPGLSTTAPSTSTWPAITSACAFARLSARPSATALVEARARQRPSSSRAARAMPAASRPSSARIASGSPCSTRPVRQRQAAHRHRDAGGGQRLQHRAAEAALPAGLLHRHHGATAPGQLDEAPRVERLHEARVQHRRRDPGGRQLAGRLERRVRERADRRHQHVVAVAQQLGLADRHRLQVRVERDAEAAPRG
jgi:hypothetical protein